MRNEFSKMPPADAGELHALAQSVETFQIMSSALELGFFDALEIPKNADELAEELVLNPVLTGKCCLALAASGFLEYRDEKYSLNDLSESFLLKSSPFYQGDLIGLMRKTKIERWRILPEVLKNGPSGFECGQEGVFDESFIHAMAQGAVRGDLQKTIMYMRENPDFSTSKSMLDLGGGHALYSIAFTRLNPDLYASVFDLPAVISAVTEKNVSAYGAADQVSAVPGDFTRDNLGGGYDLVFASDVLYRPKDVLNDVLDRIHSSLKEDGVFISKHWHIDDPLKDRTAVYFDLMFSLSEEADRIYSTGEFSEILGSGGFSVEEIYDLNHAFHPSRIIKARKVNE